MRKGSTFSKTSKLANDKSNYSCLHQKNKGPKTKTFQNVFDEASREAVAKNSEHSKRHFLQIQGFETVPEDPLDQTMNSIGDQLNKSVYKNT